jgi:thiamine-monophosphate kinase
MRCSIASRARCARLREDGLIDRLRAAATHPAARGLLDDAAVLAPPLGRDIVATHDLLAQGVHFLGEEPPADLAHKLLAVNLSDLAAMGARPLGVLLGLGLAGQGSDWVDAFAAGLGEACARWSAPLLGGDTVMGLDRLVLGLTALGQVAPGRALSRVGARPGDRLWVSGSIGDAGLGLGVAQGRIEAPADARASVLARYRRPEPRLALGAALADAGLASACLDVSDGLLIDAARLAEASGLRAVIDLPAVPLSRSAETLGADRLAAATAGDDYELLFAVPPSHESAILNLGRRLKLRLTRVGRMENGSGLAALDAQGRDVTPERLGWLHSQG